MGERSTLLPISFLEVGLQRARSVARVKRDDGTLGSGFLTANNIFVTNHHVIGSAGDANTAVAQFNYQQTETGLDLEPAEFRFDPDSGFATSPMNEDDWTLVRVRGDANVVWGAIPMRAVDVKLTEWVNIIQHPGGGSKQIALYHNVVTYVDKKRVQYLTDTLPGSSGSPVFDSEWRVVALHHSGGWITEPKARNWLGRKRRVFRNEGVNINRVIEALEASGLCT
jgi:V8-like Glu-specific endopeptidase